jgi:hypothetical protein
VVECDRIEIPHNLHMIADKADRNHDYSGYATGSELAEVIADIGLKPRDIGRA